MTEDYHINENLYYSDEDGEFMDFDRKNYDWYPRIPVPDENLYFRFQFKKPMIEEIMIFFKYLIKEIEKTIFLYILAVLLYVFMSKMIIQVLKSISLNSKNVYINLYIHIANLIF